MPLTGKPSNGSQGFQAIGTYTPSAVQTVQYGTGGIVNSSTTMPLYCYYRYPVGLDPRVAVPLVIVLSGGGFDHTFVAAGITDPFGNPIADHLHLDFWIDLVRAGGVVMAPDYRSSIVVPWNHADLPTDTLKRWATRAARIDQNKGFDWAVQYAQRVTSNYLIDPRRVFVVGHSAGGQSTCRLCVARPNQIRGAVGYCCELGLQVSFTSPQSSDDHTRDIRAEIVETDITLSTPPIKLYLTDNDAITPPAGALRDRMLALGGHHPAPTVRTSVLGPSFHDGPPAWDNVEEVRTWFNSLMSGLSSARPSKLVYA